MTARFVSNWNYPTAVRFGEGRSEQLPTMCRDLGMSRPLFVTDPGLAGLPTTTRLVDHVRAAGLGVEVFSDVKGNPTGANVEAGVAAYKRGRHDGVIALGGGSALDVGKAIALMAGQDRPMWDFEDVGDNWTRVNVAGVAKTIAIPTTAGTGSEVGRSSVITHEGEHRKVIIFHPSMMPAIALCDPTLSVGLPPHLTAATGMDALSHCLEAYCANGFHPQADGIGLEGMRLVREHLQAAFDDGANIEARGQMLAASLMGATAFQKGLGAMHAMSHPIGAQIGAHHGLTNAVVMPYVLAFNRRRIEDRLARAAAYLDLGLGFDAFLAWVIELRASLGIPNTLRSLNVTEAHIEALAAAAVVDPAGGGNPIAMDEEGYRVLFAAALSGDLPEPA